MQRLAMTGALGAAALAAGCASVPKLDIAPVDGRPSQHARIVDHILCEIANANKDDLNLLVERKYVFTAALTLQAEDKFGLTPSLSFIDPLRIAGTSYTSALGGELSQTRLRTFTHNFTFKVGDLVASRPCEKIGPVYGLRGDLGIRDVISAGLHGISSSDLAKLPAPPTFGSTIQFKYTGLINGGPNWVKTDFKGPSGTAGLANAARTQTDNLIIGFAPPAPKTTAALAFTEEEEAASAAAAARELVTTMILQNLTIPNR